MSDKAIFWTMRGTVIAMAFVLAAIIGTWAGAVAAAIIVGLGFTLIGPRR